ncbi:MAG: ATP-binding protein [Nitrospirota bacterium]
MAFKGSGQGEAGFNDRELRPKVKWLMILRVTVVTLLLGSLAILQIYQSRTVPNSIYFIIIATYFLTIFYSILFNSIGNLAPLTYVQILVDLGLETSIVFVTGGVDSAFSFTFFFSIIAAGIMLFRRGAFLVASLAGIAYGALVDLQYYGVIIPSPDRLFTQSEVFYNIFLNFVAFYTVAFLASSLSERLKATRKELEEKAFDLRELQALNENIVRSMADGMVTMDLEGRIGALNNAAHEITGLKFEDVRGHALDQFFMIPDFGHKLGDIRSLDKAPCRCEVSFPKGGKRLTLGLTVSLLKNEKGEAGGLLCIFQDITLIKQMEAEIKQKDRLAAIGELSAGMAHEIRNPLASLSGSLQILKSELLLSDDNRNLMDIALNEMDRLNRIVTEFLIYARPKPLVKEQCDIVEIVRDTVNLVKGGGEFAEGVRFTVDLPDSPVLIRADHGQMRQVLLNLMLNAVQSLSGPGAVKVKAEPFWGEAVVSVEDDGEGISGEDLDKIFYPFYSTKEGGSGLGLAIVYRIIEDHGGRIKVESTPDKGSKFTLNIPAGRAD